MSSTRVYCSAPPLSLDIPFHPLTAQSQQHRGLPFGFCERSMMLQGWQHIKLRHTRTSEEKYSCLFSALGSVEMKKKHLLSITFPAFLQISSTISYKYCESNTSRNKKDSKHEKKGSFFFLVWGNSVTVINISFEQHRKASWPYRLKSNIFNFFDVFPRRRRWPEEEKYILHF